MGKLNAGDLNQRIALLTDTAGPSDGQGGRLPGAASEQELWARVRPLRIAEKVALGQTLATEAYEITIRHLPLVAPAQRVRWQNKTLQVQGVTPDEQSEFLLLTCLTSGH